MLMEEFSRQANMESDLGIMKSALAMKPVTGSMLALANSQVGFMKLFAIPLFKNLTEVLPELQFSVEQLNQNMSRWQRKVQDCATKDQPTDLDLIRDMEMPLAVEERKTNGLLQEPKPSPSSISNSRRSSALWSEDSDAEFGGGDETPRSSTGSRAVNAQRRNTNAHSNIRPAKGEIPNGWAKNESSSRDSQATHDTSQHPYQQSSNNLTVPNSTEDMQRPRSSPEFDSNMHEKNGGVAVGEARMKRKPSRFFKAKLWNKFRGKDQESG